MNSFFVLVWTLVLLPLLSGASSLDPASSVLLEGATGSSPTFSGRYTKRPEKFFVETNDDSMTVKLKPASSGSSKVVETGADQFKKKKEAKKSSEVEPLIVDKKEVKADSSLPKDLPGKAPVLEQVRDMVLGSSPEESLIYQQSVHPEDVRRNLVQIDVAPLLLYLDSSSSYSFRRYSFYSHGLNLSAQVFLSRFLSIWGSYATSMGGDISSQGPHRVGVAHQRIQLGFDVRRHYGLGRKAPSLSYGLYFSEVNFRVPNEEEQKTSLKTSGFGLRMQVRVPVSSRKAWSLGVGLAPSLTHVEQSTGLALKSGDSVKTNELSLQLGYEYKFSRQDRVFWNLKVSSEKNIFSGAASALDPQSGEFPRNVSATQTSTTLSFGYRWGN